MDLEVIGCHGGETPHHRTSAFSIDRKIAIDAGSITSGMELETQCALEACLISHAHLDHVRDLATLADNRAQNGCPPLIVAATRETIAILRRHFFNDKLWPDFSKIPDATHPTIRYQVLKPEVQTKVAGYTVRSILVNHTIECCAFVIEGPSGALAYSGDTGPTDRLWEVLSETPNLRAFLMEVSFPNGEQSLADVSGHHTPQTLQKDMKKINVFKELPTFLYHMKPTFQSVLEKECARIRGLNLTVLSLGDRFVL